MLKSCIMIALAFPLSACAVVSDYWQKPTKYSQIPHDHGAQPPPVGALSMDASRRLLINQPDPLHAGQRFTCSEPPPDVVKNTLAQTLASLETKAGTSASAGSAYQTVAQVLANRTSTVEFWRTTSSMYCQLLMNGRTTEADAYLKAAVSVISNTKDTAASVAAAQPFIDALVDIAKQKSETAKGQNANQAAPPAQQ